MLGGSARSRAPMHGPGGSLKTLITRSRYRELRPGLDNATLAAVIEAEPRFIDDWLNFSADKRTSSGWGFYADGESGWVVDTLPDEAGESVTRRHTNAAEACADYVLSELD